MKKIIFALIMTFACTQIVEAQTFHEFGSDIYGLQTKQKKVDQKWTRALQLGVGNSVEVGFQFRRNFCKWLAWDVFTVKYAYNYGKDYMYWRSFEADYYTPEHEIKWHTGVRFFSPRLWRDDAKAYLAIGFGYVPVCYEENHQEWTKRRGYYWNSYSDWGWHSMINGEVGLNVTSHIGIGYAFSYMFDGTDGYDAHCDHMFRLSYEF